MFHLLLETNALLLNGDMSGPVIFLQPEYQSGHPENYLFSLSKKIFSGSKYPKNSFFNFEKGRTGLVKCKYVHEHITKMHLYSVLSHTSPNFSSSVESQYLLSAFDYAAIHLPIDRIMCTDCLG